MFRGVNPILLDDKGRMTMSARYLKMISESNNQMVVTIDTDDPCLLLYPLSIWCEIEKKIETLPSFNKEARRIQRILLGHATEVALDAQHRILIPPALREFAELEKNVMLVGQGKKFEIWNENTWNTLRQTWLNSPDNSNESLPAIASLSL